MQQFIQHKKFRGQDTTIIGSRLGITIRVAQPQRDTPPTIGLSDALLDYSIKRGLTIYVTVKAPQCSFKVSPREWLKTAKKEEQPSYYNKPWFIYRGPIPKIAFKSPEEQEREEYYQQHSAYGQSAT